MSLHSVSSATSFLRELLQTVVIPGAFWKHLLTQPSSLPAAVGDDHLQQLGAEKGEEASQERLPLFSGFLSLAPSPDLPESRVSWSTSVAWKCSRNPWSR